MENVKLNTIEEAIEDFKAGNFVICLLYTSPSPRD